MINRESLEAALPLAELLDRNNMVLVPRVGSPLAELVKATKCSTGEFATPVGQTMPVYQPSMYDIEYLTNSKESVGGTCDHDIALDAIVEMAAKGAANYQLVIKTGVIPAVMDLCQRVTKAMEDMPIASMLGMEVKIYDLPLPLKSPQIEALISKWTPVAHASPALRMKCPEIPVEEIKDFLKTGSGAFDTEVQKWAAAKGDSFLLQLWEDIFTTNNDNFTKFSDAVNCRTEGLDRALGIFLIARKLVDTPPEGTRMPLPSLKELAAEYRNQAAAKIAYALEDWAKVKKAGILVRRTEDGCVQVNDVVYRPWITEQGGSNEMLFGALAKKTGFISTAQFNQAGPDLMQAYTRLLATSQLTSRNERYRQLKQLLLSQFKRQLDEAGGRVDGQDDTGADDRARIVEDFRRELAKLSIDDLSCTEDLHEACLKLVCRSRFAATAEVETFIRTMMRVEKETPGITPREAATIATLEYVCSWVSAQMQAVPVGSR